MEPSIYNSILSQISKRYNSIDFSNFSGFKQDIDHFIFESKIFDSYKLTEYPNESEIIFVSIIISDKVRSLQELHKELERLIYFISYKDLLAFTTTWYKELLQSRFITLIESQYFISGTIEIKGNIYSKLAKNFENDFHKLPSNT